MKTISKLILIPLMVTFLFFACSKDEDTPEPVPIPIATLSSISPQSGLKEVEVTFTGTNFGTDKSKVKVFFNTTEATVQSVTNTQIKTIAPSNGSSGAVKIIVNGKTVSGPVFTYLQPTLSSISPESAPRNGSVTFIGSNFGTDASKIKVFFSNGSMSSANETEAVIESVTNTVVVVVVPIEAATGTVRMEVDGTELSGPEFTVLDPTLISITPLSGAVGTEVTITGSTFGTDTSKVQVFFNGVGATIESLTDTEIKVLVPEGAITGLVEIFINDGDLPNTEFTVLPSIISMSPESGIKESEVTINGSSFGTNIATVEVFFNGKEAEVLSVTDTEIKVKVPVKAFTGLVKVSVDDIELIGPVFTYIVSEIKVSTLAGSGFGGFKDGIGTAAQFLSPIGVAIDNLDNIYVADRDNYILRKITPDGVVSTLAGEATKNGDVNGTGSEARFAGVNAIVFTESGDMLVSDNGNHKIKKVTTAGVVTTFAGTGINGSNNGPALSATFKQTAGMAIDSQGNVFVVETDDHSIRKITPSGEVSLFAGGQNGINDGNGTNARFTFPQGIAVDAANNLYVTDGANHLIRKITPNADVTTIAGSSLGFADGQGAAAKFNFPTGIVVDKQGDIYVVDKNNHSIRKISSDGSVTTIAGDGTITDFNSPYGITIDALGDLYVADQSKHRIRKITQE
tara:strand:+ start:57076 stop:59124 length:2049 start_codon:yes stop_codon:yes gene_type:complete